MPRSTAQVKKDDESSTGDNESSKKLLIINKEALDSSGTLVFCIRQLKHPKTREPAYYAIDSKNYKIYELVNYEHDLNSVFIDEYISSECKLNFASKFNISYMLLSMCFESQNEFICLTRLNLFTEDADDKVIKNLNEFYKLFINVDELNDLFEVKYDENGSVLVKFNLAKCIKWLREKIVRLNLYFMSLSARTVKKIGEGDADSFRFDSFELIAQYIDNGLCDILRTELNINGLDGEKSPKRIKSETRV
jgi:hypothetical protein